MKITTITPAQFLEGCAYAHPRMTHHTYAASLEWHAIRVVDASGAPVKVEYGGSSDNRTVYAHIAGEGYIGGWRYPHKKMPWDYLATCINRGVLHERMETLPHRFNAKTIVCPHCQATFTL